MIPCEFVQYVQGRVKFLKDEDERLNRKFALLATVFANIHRGKRKAFKIDDFMPRKKQTTEQMLKQVEMLNQLFGGEDKRVQNGSK